MSTFYANPYAFDAQGFYFKDLDDYEEKLNAAMDIGVEEFSIEFIDGPSDESALANQLLRQGVLHQGTMDVWYDELELLDENEKAALYWLSSRGSYPDIEQQFDKMREIAGSFGEMTLDDYVYDYVDDQGAEAIIKGNERYFDWEQYGRDLWSNQESETLEALGGRDLSDEDLGMAFADEYYGRGQLPPEAEHSHYFDYEAFKRDIEAGGDIDEFTFADSTWINTDPHA